MIRIATIVFTLIIVFTSCKRVEKKNIESDNSTPILEQAKPSQDHLIMATLWFQKSAERRALSYQAFNWATIMLDNHLKDTPDSLPRCVILDIDETVLDNSLYEGKCIKTGKPYTPESWKEWTDMANASAIPGALDFCNYAKERGVEVFYVSNRMVNEIDSSVKNLKSLGFPFADRDHCYFQDKDKSKKQRRASIAITHKILMLLGDNLNDFSEIFENRNDDFGFAEVDRNKNQFGSRFILLPNPMYGSWERPILNQVENNDFTKNEKRKHQIESL